MPLFSWQTIVWGVLQGFVAFAMVAAIFVVAWSRGMPEGEVRALAFFSLVLAIVSLIFVNRSFSTSVIAALRRPNRTLVLVLVGVVVMLFLTLVWPLLSGLFHFGPLHWDDLLLTVTGAFAVLLILEGGKAVMARRRSA